MLSLQAGDVGYLRYGFPVFLCFLSGVPWLSRSRSGRRLVSCLRVERRGIEVVS